LIGGRLGTPTPRSDLVRLAVRLIVDEAVDVAATDVVGWERCGRATDSARGHRPSSPAQDSR
jgi:hypothetical protein